MNSNNVIATSTIMHEILNNVSSIMSISQLALLNHNDISPELQQEMKRLVTTSKQLSTNVQSLANVLDEDS